MAVGGLGGVRQAESTATPWLFCTITTVMVSGTTSLEEGGRAEFWGGEDGRARRLSLHIAGKISGGEGNDGAHNGYDKRRGRTDFSFGVIAMTRKAMIIGKAKQQWGLEGGINQVEPVRRNTRDHGHHDWMRISRMRAPMNPLHPSSSNDRPGGQVGFDHFAEAGIGLRLHRPGRCRGWSK